jgi:electron transfer flavoprotein alpha subunit
MPDENGVLVIAEAGDDGELAPISAELMGIGRRLADESSSRLTAVLPGSGVERLAEQLGQLGADVVYVADGASLASYEGEAYTHVAQEAVKQASPAIVLAGQTQSGRDLAARLAFRLETGVATDCTQLRLEAGELVMTKPVFGGSALADYVCPDSRPQMATIRPRAFEAAEPQGGRQAEIVRLDISGFEARAKVLDTVKETATAGPQLKDAKVVVSGGRGLGGPENWHVVEELAEPLGAAVGATRAVTDAGWVPPSLQVGLTGVTITPDLYITVAVSGAVQHIAGCSGARNVVAINKDPEANIFKHARYGVVGDWKEVLPAFTSKVRELVGR